MSKETQNESFKNTIKPKKLVLVFTRNPELGKCKTRLAKTIGDINALEVYRMLLKHTEEVIRNGNYDKAVYYSVRVHHNDIWDDKKFQKHAQKGDDLGIRMLNAFKDSFDAGYDQVLIVGSDLYDLTSKHINDAFTHLNTNDVVLGPALDGGYYLLGMNTLYTPLFYNKEWGTATVQQSTLNDLKDKKVALLEPLNDIDTYEDIKPYNIFKQFLN